MWLKYTLPVHANKKALLPIFIITIIITACHQPGNDNPPIIIQNDSSSAVSIKSPNSSKQTPYQCATFSLRAIEKGDLKLLLPYIHPIKGLTITHVDEYIQNHEKPFTIEEMENEIRKPTTYTIINGYEEEVKRKSTPADLLKYYATSSTANSKNDKSRFFSTAKDVRRNYIGNGTYTLTPPLSAGQTTVSYHFSDSTQEMSWQEIVLRTETYQNKDYLVEMVCAFWTP